MSTVVRLERISPYAVLPSKGSKGSAYYDIYATEDVVVDVGNIVTVSTGWKVEMLPGWFLDVRPRSGMSLKGITINNSPGTVDPDYRGELKIILVNHGLHPFFVKRGDRIAQCAPMRVVQMIFSVVDTLSETPRGEQGLGSTGR